jgi:hypothetical protein
LERKPRSARHRYPRFPPRVLSAPVTADVRRNAKEGNAVVLRPQCVGTGRRHGTPSHAYRDASFTRSFDPFSSILTMHRRGKTRRWWGARGDIAAGQTRVTGRNQHRDRRSGRSAARHASLLSNEGRDAERKGRWSRPSSLRGAGVLVWLPARRLAVAEVVRRRLVSNKLGIRAAKTAAGSSERGPSSKGTAVGETIDGFGE